MKKTNLTLFCIFFLFFVAPNVFAIYDWKQYNNEFTPMWGEQFQGSHGIFNNNINESNLSKTYTPFVSYTQPLISQLGFNDTDSGLREYLIFPNGNFLQIYDKAFTFFDEINTGGNPIGQISTVDWNRDGHSDEIVGVFDTPNTSLQVYHYNVNINKYSLLSSYNFNDSNIVKAYGVRSSGSKTYFMAQNSTGNIFLATANSSNGTDIQVKYTEIVQTNFTNLFFREPLAFIDMDNDNLLEFIYYDSLRAIVFDEAGNVQFFKNQTSPITTIMDVKMVQVDLTNQWRIAILYGTGITGQVNLGLFRLDGSTLWTQVVLPSNINFNSESCKMAISDNYDSDFVNNDNSIYVGCTETFLASGYHRYFKIIKGNNGAYLVNFDSGVTAGTSSGLDTLTIADMNNDNKNDFIYGWKHADSRIDVFNPVNLSYILNVDFGFGLGTPVCVPADLNVDGKLELTCQNSGSTNFFYVGNISNSNPSISQVSYSPSLLLSQGQVLSAIITASDPENDQILYSIKCSDSDAWSVDSLNPTQSCQYNSIGVFNNYVRVRDFFHSTYSDFVNVTVTVTATGGSCNNNNVCESNLGENTNNCPNDCPTTPDTITTVGGTTLPTKLVDVKAFQEGRDAGMLPEIYMGTLGFFSQSFHPLFAIILICLIAMIITALCLFIAKLIKGIS